MEDNQQQKCSQYEAAASAAAHELEMAMHAISCNLEIIDRLRFHDFGETMYERGQRRMSLMRDIANKMGTGF